MTDAFGDPDDTTINVPRPFNGSRAQRKANHASHQWRPDTGRCAECEVRIGSTSAYYRCGAPIPRLNIEGGTPEADAALKRVLGIGR